MKIRLNSCGTELHFLTRCMYKYPLVFWTSVIIAVCWCGLIFVDSGISEFYHPMAARGDRLHWIRKYAVGIPILVSIAMLVIWVWKRPLAKLIYALGIVPLCLAIALTFLPRVDSEYTHEYWLGENPHRIPWAYNPSLGQSEPGGTYFVVKVRGFEFVPFYSGVGEKFDLGKAIDYNYGRGGNPPENGCDVGAYVFQCEWKSGDYVYNLSSDIDNILDDPQSLFQSVEELLDSFETESY